MKRVDVVGREAELADLERIVFDEGVGVALTGARGVGKTALWESFLDRAAGRVVLRRVTATEALQSIPFGALASFLGQLPDSPLNPVQLFNIAVAAVHGLGQRQRLVLGVDDAHLLDDASASVIELLMSDTDVVVVAAVPSEQPMPGWLAPSTGRDRVRRYELGPLDRSGSARLVSSVLGGAVDGSAQTELWRLSGGNPLVIRQLMATAVESAVLTKRGSSWTFEGPFVAAGELGEILDGRLAARGPEELATLELAAVAGVVELGLVEALAGEAFVEPLEVAELIRVDSDDRRMTVRLRHPLLSQRLEQSMPVTGRRRISRSLAEWVVATGARRVGDVLRVATWQLAGGVTVDADLAVRAARQALGGADPVLAERLSRAALAAGGGFEAQLALGQALFEQGDSVGADEVLLAAQQAADGDSESVRATSARCQVLALGRADPAAAIDVATETAATISDPDWVDELAAELARLALAAGDPIQAIELAQQIAGRDQASPRAVLTSMVVSAPAQVMAGRFGGAISDARRGLALIDDGADGPLLGADQLLLAQAEALLYAGQLTEAAAIADTGCQTGLNEPLSPTAGAWQALQGQTLLLTGDVAGSRSLYDQSVAALTVHDPLGLLPRARARQALALAHGGDSAATQAALAAIDPDFVEANYRVQVIAEQAAAWIMALAGDTESAARQTLKAALAALDHHHYAMAAIALHDAVRFGHPETVTNELSRVSEQFEGSTLLLAFVLHATALVTANADGLDTVSETYAGLGANLLAAEAATQAATTHRSANHTRAAARSHTRAAALLARCPGAHTPATRHREPLLTPRQNQIARLAPRHTNAEIADQLYISTRTVENHLHAIYSALGIHNRADLTNIADPERHTDT